MKKSLILFVLCILLSVCLLACGSSNGCDHSDTAVTREEETLPTCTDGGTYDIVTSCNLCGAELERKSGVSDPLSHDIVTNEGKAPTCLGAGYTEYSTCKRCDYTTYSELAPLGHSMVRCEAKAPTCTEAGYDEYTACSACDYTTYSEIAPLGHDEISHEAKAPTCTEIGYDAYVTCSVCDYTTYAEKEALGHTEITDARIEPTCTKTGLTEGVHCSACGVVFTNSVEIPMVSHTYDNERDEECDVCGFVRDIACLHSDTVSLNYRAATCISSGFTRGERCLICEEILVKQEEIPALGHDTVTTEAKAPTCIEIGWNEYVSCRRCTYTTYSEKAALGHDLINLEDIPPTCTEWGYYNRVECTACSYAVYSGTPPTGHGRVTDPRVEPTCTETGLTEGSHCPTCGVILWEQNVIPAKGHIRMEHLPKEPMCEEDGYSAYVSCFRCGDIIEPQEIIPALGHNYVNHRCTVCAKREPAGDFSDMYDYLNMEDGTCYVTGFFGDVDRSITDIEIPTVSPEGYRVVGINRQAFYQISYITSVKIPDTIKEIGSMAFMECTSLKNIVIPNSVAKIGESAFYGCKSLEGADIGDGVKELANGIFAECENLTDIKFGESIEAIGESAFARCSSLTMITVPGGVTKIGDFAFADCSSLSNITLPDGLLKIEDGLFSGCVSLVILEIPDSVVSVGSNAFAQCTSLTELKIGKGLASIGDYAFFGATSIKNITVDNKNSSYTSKDGNLYSKDEKTLVLYSAAKDSSSFEIPNTVDTISEHAFSEAIHLTEIIIPDSVKSIGMGAFWNCKSLGKIKIPDGVTELPSSLFYSCESLIEVDIPASVTKIGDYAFTDCSSLKNVNYGGNESEWKAVDKGSYGNEALENTTVNCKHEHTPGAVVKENIVSSTCTEKGSCDEVVRCSLCGEELSRVTVEIPLADHKLSDGECTECGEKSELVRDGNYIYFGEYPQSIKADGVTIDLNTCDSRGYCLGSDGFYYAAVTANPCMAGYTFTNNVMILSGTVYYFKVEPIRWRILTESDGRAFVLCDSIIATMPFDAYENGGSNNYKDSDVRAWLNSTFYEIAFTELQRGLIFTTTVDNSPASTGDASTMFACENTEDKLFLLSYAEMTSSEYGFADQSIKDEARRIKTGDYARAMGAYMSTEYAYHGNGNWWLRSPWLTTGSTKFVFYDGSAKNNTPSSSKYMGVVPAMWINLSGAESAS